MRRALDLAVPAVAWTCAALACAVLALLVAAIATRGLPVVSWEFLSAPMRAAGAGGGIVHQLAGTALLVATAAAVCTPLALGLALVHGVYLRGAAARRRLETALYLAGSLPSILFGIVGLVLFVLLLGWGKSWLAGGIVLALVILPTVSIALVERIAAIPRPSIEAARALGLRESQVVRSVVLRQSAGSLVTGLLLGLARAAGEVAPILFVAVVFAGATLPGGVVDSPVLALPYHVFVLAQDTYDPEAARRVWGAATVLLLVVLAMSALALPFRLRMREEAGRG